MNITNRRMAHERAVLAAKCHGNAFVELEGGVVGRDPLPSGVRDRLTTKKSRQVATVQPNENVAAK
jgi:hypothetical protein